MLPILFNNKNSYNIPDSITKSGLRIAIIMLNSPDIPNYAHFATMNNYLYATKHNYDFIVERQPRDIKHDWTWNSNKQSSVSWYKAELVKKHLKNYHYVLFIDSDAIFTGFDYLIEEELVPLINDKTVMIFQEDVWESTIIEHVPNKICTGLIFAKSCPLAFDILDLWILAPYNNNNCFEFRYKHPREQACLEYILKEYNIWDNIYIYPGRRKMFGQYDANWIIHMAGTNDKNRSELISRYFDSKYNDFIRITRQQLYGNKKN